MERIECEEALQIAGEVMQKFIPLTQKLKIGGSIRRSAEMIKDIELVCIPKWEATQKGLFGKDVSKTYSIIPIHNKIHDIAHLVRKMGLKYTQFEYIGEDRDDPIVVDMFISTIENWGLNYLLRTGPAEFNTWLLAQANKKGLTSSGSILCDIEQPNVSFPAKTEEEVFEILKMKYIKPEDREKWRMGTAFKEALR